MKTCFLFPGQGSQYPGMGKDLWESSGTVKEIFRTASEISGMDLTSVLFEGTDEQLKSTDVAQPAITVVNLSAAACLAERGIGCDGCAGFSLGEYSALHAAGVFGLRDVFELVKIRGEVMERVSRTLDAGTDAAGMTAVLGLDRDTVLSVLERGKVGGVFTANYNSPTQVVLSGTAAGLDGAEELLKAAGAKRCIRLKVSGPFHSPLMNEARVEFTRALARFRFADPVIPVYSNVTGARITSGDQARDLCAAQIVSTVKWEDEERCLVADGYERCLEAGPGKVLTGLWKAISAEPGCVTAGTTAEIDALTGQPTA